jgi:hypothetical protein
MACLLCDMASLCRHGKQDDSRSQHGTMHTCVPQLGGSTGQHGR